ncbi:SDR family oxidoreductase [Mycobacterium sp. MYCO198283]|uniref:SDR family oxidoreductase n=1 Tax=Mycobacterium sp. MYCO198283 TaxID=2883505 RepID=UPI001E40CFBB|nr:SDR family oxidoreductase [Mycobacterium sp. MYCO198283]MCG5431968.1 SDR family oxidoreductase [Mycobacterium sp. MYCO198283]
MPGVLVTGASRGIGHAIATRLAADGWEVFGGVRTDRDADQLGRHPRIRPVVLDVTDEAHIAALPAALPERLDALVNNAGIAVGGPLETISPADIRRQLEVNVVGQLAVTQALLPRLRASRGRIVFISSVNGQVSAPFFGAYGASKFGLEAAAHALRMELRPWHIGVSIVEPAQTSTDMWHTAEQVLDDTVAQLSADHRRLYGRHIEGFRKAIPVSQRMAAPPEKVADVVERALTAKRPKARYVVGAGPALAAAIVPRLPLRLSDPILRRVMGQPARL